jgi:hypothetical protein
MSRNYELEQWAQRFYKRSFFRQKRMVNRIWFPLKGNGVDLQQYKSALETIADHVPLEEGEAEILRLLDAVVGINWTQELRGGAEREWWGEKALSVIEGYLLE